MTRIELPTPLPHGVVASEFTYANGTTETVYLAAVQAEGPVRLADRRGEPVLAFMYDFFLFTWRQHAATVDILHGRIATLRVPATDDPHQPSNMMLFRNIAIEGTWSEQVLRQFGTEWARERRAWARAVASKEHSGGKHGDQGRMPTPARKAARPGSAGTSSG